MCRPVIQGWYKFRWKDSESRYQAGEFGSHANADRIPPVRHDDGIKWAHWIIMERLVRISAPLDGDHS